VWLLDFEAGQPVINRLQDKRSVGSSGCQDVLVPRLG